jgi:hypothetical protein
MVSTFPRLIPPDGSGLNDLHDDGATDKTSDQEGGASNDHDGVVDGGEDIEVRNVQPFVTVNNDPELTALYRQLADLNDKILARWVANHIIGMIMMLMTS